MPRAMTKARNADKTPIWMMLHGLLATALVLALVAGPAKGEEKIIKSYGYSFFGELSYPEDFKHFNYVNPEAPKGGELAISVSGTFNSMNPYTRKGKATGTRIWTIYESLLGDGPADAYGEYYGLLAKSLEYDEGKNWVIFHMRPEAKFSDGTPVTAHDIVFSHNLFLEQGLPSYALAVKKQVLSAEALDDHTVKFTFAKGISRRSLIEQVGGVPAFSKKWYEETGAKLNESRLTFSPGSGPYVVEEVVSGRRVTYKRDPEYWGRDLPRNVGRHNFDRIRIEYFADDSTAFENFKTGTYFMRSESDPKKWATSFDFPAVKKGHVKVAELADGTPPTPTGLVFNMRRDVLKDKRVREALSLAFNFEWTNESLQYGLFAQRHSFVENAPHQAKGVPEGAELEFLKSLGDLVPEEIFTEPAVMAHTSKPARPQDRRNLRKALKILAEAGWNVDGNGKLRNAEGKTLDIKILLPASVSSTLSAAIETYAQTLERMGVNVDFDQIDAAQYTLRTRDFDYDMIYDNYRSFLSTGTGLMQMYGSEEAAISLFNPAGLASPLVDAIIKKSLETTTREDELIALSALDRVLRHERFMIPMWYKDKYWVAYWDMYEHPEEIPQFDLGITDFWWVNPEKEAALKASGALR